VVANAAPAALKKPLRDRFMSSFSFLLVYSRPMRTAQKERVAKPGV
jgi:hypothetical protein